MSKKKSILVVGAGLAGICVSLQLQENDCAVTIVDNGVNFSSRVAVGMINPLVFRRMTKSWRVDEFLPYLKTFYLSLEKESKSHFFFPIPIRRLFSSEQERDFWLKKEQREDFKPYMNKVSSDDYTYSGGKNPFGSGRVNDTFFLDVHLFYRKMMEKIEKEGNVLREEFDFNELNENIYKGKRYDDIIFCQGYLNKDNPFFNYLPVDPTKGQVLTIKTDKLPENISLNRKCFILPKGNQTFKVGSTYEWHNTTTNITEESKQHILTNLSFILEDKVDVIDQIAGVRPTVKDRRPVIGTHTKFKNYHIFNGLGAKGYMLAPLLSREFIDYLLNNVPLSKEVDINRFNKSDFIK